MIDTSFSNKNKPNLNRGAFDPISISVLGFLVISVFVTSILLIRGNFDIRERAADSYSASACQACRQAAQGTDCSGVCNASQPSPSTSITLKENYVSCRDGHECTSGYCGKDADNTFACLPADLQTCTPNGGIQESKPCCGQGTHTENGKTVCGYAVALLPSPSSILDPLCPSSCSNGCDNISNGTGAHTCRDYCKCSAGCYYQDSQGGRCKSDAFPSGGPILLGQACDPNSAVPCTAGSQCFLDKSKPHGQYACQIPPTCPSTCGNGCSTGTTVCKPYCAPENSQHCTNGCEPNSNGGTCKVLSCLATCGNGCSTTDNNHDGQLDCKSYCKSTCGEAGCLKEDENGGTCLTPLKSDWESCERGAQCLSGYCGKDPGDNTFACLPRPVNECPKNVSIYETSSDILATVSLSPSRSALCTRSWNGETQTMRYCLWGIQSRSAPVICAPDPGSIGVETCPDVEKGAVFADSDLSSKSNSAPCQSSDGSVSYTCPFGYTADSQTNSNDEENDNLTFRCISQTEAQKIYTCPGDVQFSADSIVNKDLSQPCREKNGGFIGYTCPGGYEVANKVQGEIRCLTDVNNKYVAVDGRCLPCQPGSRCDNVSIADCLASTAKACVQNYCSSGGSCGSHGLTSTGQSCKNGGECCSTTSKSPTYSLVNGECQPCVTACEFSDLSTCEVKKNELISPFCPASSTQIKEGNACSKTCGTVSSTIKCQSCPAQFGQNKSVYNSGSLTDEKTVNYCNQFTALALPSVPPNQCSCLLDNGSGQRVQVGYGVSTQRIENDSQWGYTCKKSVCRCSGNGLDQSSSVEQRFCGEKDVTDPPTTEFQLLNPQTYAATLAQAQNLETKYGITIRYIDGLSQDYLGTFDAALSDLPNNMYQGKTVVFYDPSLISPRSYAFATVDNRAIYIPIGNCQTGVICNTDGLSGILAHELTHDNDTNVYEAPTYDNQNVQYCSNGSSCKLLIMYDKAAESDGVVCNSDNGCDNSFLYRYGDTGEIGPDYEQLADASQAYRNHNAKLAQEQPHVWAVLHDTIFNGETYNN